jgi:hypothetical protein
MQTVFWTDENGEERCAPVVQASVDGQFVPVTATVTPEQCDHHDATWSADLDMRCPECGMRLFLSGRLLANQPEDRISEMYCMWQAAGCPVWSNGSWQVNPSFWTMVERPAFMFLNGLPVLKSKLAAFEQEFPE